MNLRFILLLTFFIANASAITVEKRLQDEVKEQQAMQLFLEIKCLVCEGQSIESSNTEFSSQMRQLIREKISSGKSSKEVKQELVAEFGDGILISTENKFILLLPFIFAALILFIFIKYTKKISRHR